jgi:hypothetical protein
MTTVLVRSQTLYFLEEISCHAGLCLSQPGTYSIPLSKPGTYSIPGSTSARLLCYGKLQHNRDLWYRRVASELVIQYQHPYILKTRTLQWNSKLRLGRIKGSCWLSVCPTIQDAFQHNFLFNFLLHLYSAGRLLYLNTFKKKKSISKQKMSSVNQWIRLDWHAVAQKR